MHRCGAPKRCTPAVAHLTGDWEVCAWTLEHQVSYVGVLMGGGWVSSAARPDVLARGLQLDSGVCFAHAGRDGRAELKARRMCLQDQSDEVTSKREARTLAHYIFWNVIPDYRG